MLDFYLDQRFALFVAISVSDVNNFNEIELLGELLQVIIGKLKYCNLLGTTLTVMNIYFLGKHPHLGNDPFDQKIEANHLSF